MCNFGRTFLSEFLIVLLFVENVRIFQVGKFHFVALHILGKKVKIKIGD